jgi:hypothetical protein
MAIFLRPCPVGQINGLWAAWAFYRETAMHAQFSELVEISKLNGDFKKNYGKIIGAYLYLCSISAVRGRSLLWTGLMSIVGSAALAWVTRRG